MASQPQLRAQLQSSASPVVLVLSSQAAEASAATAGLTVAELLTPAGASLKPPSSSGAVSGVKFRYPHEVFPPTKVAAATAATATVANALGSNINLPPPAVLFTPTAHPSSASPSDAAAALASAAAAASQASNPDPATRPPLSSGIPPSTPWFSAWRAVFEDALRGSEAETIDLPVGVLVVVSTADPNPSHAASSLWGPSTAPPGVLGTAGVDPSSLLRMTLVIHDVTKAAPETAGSTLSMLKASYGPSTTAMIQVNSHHQEVPMVHDIWAPHLGRPGPFGTTLSATDVEQINGFVSTLARSMLGPSMSARMRSLNDYVSDKRKGLVKSWTKWWRGGSSNNSQAQAAADAAAALSAADPSSPSTPPPQRPTGAPGMLRTGTDLNTSLASNDASPNAGQAGPATGDWSNTHSTASLNLGRRYPSTSLEMTIRSLADIAFLLGDYELAASNYKLAAADFKTDGAHLYHAAALEALAVTLFLTDGSRKDVDSNLEEAWNLYIRVGATQHATRAALRQADLTRARGKHAEAAAILLRASTEEADLTAALLLEQAAVAFGAAVPTRERKAAFHMILAGHRFGMAKLRYHTIRCYGHALAAIGAAGWSMMEDHIHFTLARQAAALSTPGAALANYSALLGRSVATAKRQATYLNDLTALYSRRFPSTGPTPPLPLPVPVVQPSSWNLASSDSALPDVTDVDWSALESRLGWSSTKLQSKDKGTNVVVGEQVVITLCLSNPLAVPLRLYGVQPVIIALDGEVAAAAASTPPVSLPRPGAAATPEPGAHPLVAPPPPTSTAPLISLPTDGPTADDSEAPSDVPGRPASVQVSAQDVELAPGGRATLSISLIMTLPGTISLTALYGLLGGTVPVRLPLKLGSRSATLVTASPSAPRLSLTLEALPSSVRVGQTVSSPFATLVITNTGPAPSDPAPKLVISPEPWLTGVTGNQWPLPTSDPSSALAAPVILTSVPALQPGASAKLDLVIRPTSPGRKTLAMALGYSGRITRLAVPLTVLPGPSVYTKSMPAPGSGRKSIVSVGVGLSGGPPVRLVSIGVFSKDSTPIVSPVSFTPGGDDKTLHSGQGLDLHVKLSSGPADQSTAITGRASGVHGVSLGLARPSGLEASALWSLMEPTIARAFAQESVAAARQYPGLQVGPKRMLLLPPDSETPDELETANPAVLWARALFHPITLRRRGVVGPGPAARSWVGLSWEAADGSGAYGVSVSELRDPISQVAAPAASPSETRSPAEVLALTTVAPIEVAHNFEADPIACVPVELRVVNRGSSSMSVTLSREERASADLAAGIRWTGSIASGGRDIAPRGGTISERVTAVFTGPGVYDLSGWSVHPEKTSIVGDDHGAVVTSAPCLLRLTAAATPQASLI